MIARALVTGGAGFIGSHLVDKLVDGCVPVTVLDDFSSGDRANLVEAEARGDVRIVEGSVLEPQAVIEAMAGCEVVYHLAVRCVRQSIGLPAESHDVNATGTLNVLEAARRRRVSRFVYCSSSEVYGNCRDRLLHEETTVCEPVTIYGAAKLAGEHYTRAYQATYGLSAVVVRPFNAYGPREHDRGELAEVIPRFVVRILNGLPPVVFGTGENGRDFTYVTEIASGLVAAAHSDRLIGRVVNIACGRMITIAEVARAVAKVCQRPDLEPVHAAPRPGDVYLLHADVTLARELLGFQARIEFERGLEMYLDWFARTHSDPSTLLEEELQNWRMPD